MRTQQEIIDKIKSTDEYDDFFGVIRCDLVDFLEYENAKEFLKEGATKKKWDKLRTPMTDAAIKKEINKYMQFAWEKANSCRGLSANRSINHMSAWLWILNDATLIEEFEETEYTHYGKEKLIVVCNALKINWKKLDDGIRTN